MRKLASVVTVEKVWNLEGKDRVQGCSFKENSYEAMVSKDIKENDLVIFIQEGSILPLTQTWKFLEKRCYREGLNGYLIVPQKFAQIKSWGLVVTPEQAGLKPDFLFSGFDVTDLLEIRKYETEVEPAQKKSKLHPFVQFCLSHKLTRRLGELLLHRSSKPTQDVFPTDVIAKSDETTLQNLKGVLDKYAEYPVYTTVKMEGQSVTFLHENKNGKPGKFYVCSRNVAYKKDNGNTLWQVAKKLQIEKKLKDFYEETGLMIVLQGELCGPGIQSNIYNFDDYRFFVYTVKEQKSDTQVSFVDFKYIAKRLGLESVPVLDEWRAMKKLLPDVETAEEYARTTYWRRDSLKHLPNEKEKLWKDYFQHEGVVVRTIPYDKSKNIGCSFKIKNIEYQEKTLKAIHDLASK